VISSNLSLSGANVYISAAANIAAASATLNIKDIVASGNIQCGNLIVQGTVTTIDATNLNVKDPLIYLAANGANQAAFTDAVDIGFIGIYGNTQPNIRYTGMFRDQSDGGFYKLIDATGNSPAPTTVVDTTNTAFVFQVLQTWLKCSGTPSSPTGTGILSVNSSGFTLTSNSTWAAALTANTLALSTALPTTSGGTNNSLTIAQGDILYGSAAGVISNLAKGADGKVLQLASNIPNWTDLDGGTF